MPGRPPHAPTAALMLLAGLLGASAWPVARLLTAALGDLDAQLSTTVLGLGLAAGAWLFAWFQRAQTAERIAHARRHACVLAFVVLGPAALAWSRLLAAGHAPLLAAGVLGAALAAAGFAFAAEWALAGERRGVAAAWSAAAALGWSAALFVTGTAAFELPGGLVSQRDSFTDSGRLEGGLAALGLRTEPARTRWDALGGMRSLALGGQAALAPHTGVQLRDGAFTGPLLGSESALLSDACGSGLLGLPTSKPRARVLLVGFGSGAGLACALRDRAKQVDIAAPSAAEADVVGAFAAGPLRDPRVRVRRVSARSWVQQPQGRGYDLIAIEDMPGKHTLPPGVLPLAEATLFTDRGLADLLAALTPDGVLQATLHREPRALRFANTARAALARLAADAPDAHIAVQSAGDTFAVSVGRLPLNINLVLDLHRRARAARGSQAPPGTSSEAPERSLAALLGVPFTPPQLEFTPGAAFQNRFGSLFGAAGPRFARTYVFDLSVPSDDRPLFDQLTRRDEVRTGSSGFGVLLGYAALTYVVVGLTLAALGARLRPPGGLRSALAFGGLGAAQVLLYAWLSHTLALLAPRPELGPALAALLWPVGSLAVGTVSVSVAAGARPFAFAALLLAGAAAVPLPVLLVLFYDYQVLLLAALSLLLLAAVAAFAHRRA